MLEKAFSNHIKPLGVIRKRSLQGGSTDEKGECESRGRTALGDGLQPVWIQLCVWPSLPQERALAAGNCWNFKSNFSISR